MSMAKRKKKPGKVSRRVSKPVRFAEIALLQAALKPPFDNGEGNYADPDVVIAGGRFPDNAPRSIPCGKQLVIYSSWADFVAPNCQGFGGANDSNNAVVQVALANAMRLANRIDCDGDCIKRVFEIWRGWSCGPEQKKFLAIAAVEVMILCRDEF
jgi:hypothetical protein